MTAKPELSPEKLKEIEDYDRKIFTSDQIVRWCPGCGDYSILAQMQKTMPEICREQGIPRENVVVISGIGCSSRFPYYMNTYGFHSIHGRAPTFASGLKISRPELQVWVVTGDGDGLSIGGNHLIHALRRNIDLKILLFNNRIYGLTKGQYSPTSEQGKKTKSTPHGSVDYPLNPLCLALAAEATFVARTIDADTKHLAGILKRAAGHKGSAFVEIYQNCNIFNDGAFKSFADKKVRDDRTLVLEHGKPMVFGKERDKGIGIDGLKPVELELDDKVPHPCIVQCPDALGARLGRAGDGHLRGVCRGVIEGHGCLQLVTVGVQICLVVGHVGERERRQLRVCTKLFAGGSQPRQPCIACHFLVGPKGQEALAVACGPLNRLHTATYPDRWVRLLYRLGNEGNVIQLVVLTVEGHPVLGPQAGNGLQLLVKEAPPLTAINTDRCEVLLPPAHCHTHDEAAVRHHIKSREVLGPLVGGQQGRKDRVEANPNRVSSGSQDRRHHQTVQNILVRERLKEPRRRHRHVRRQRGRVEAQVLGQLDEFDGLVH